MPTTPDTAAPAWEEKRDAHAGAVAFALAFETPESLARRFLRGDGHAHGGQRFLGLGAEDLLPAELLLDLLALSRQKRELDSRLLEARLEPPPGRGESIRLGAGGRGLAGQALPASLELSPALAELTRIARELGPVSSGADLLETQGLDGRPPRAQLDPARFQIRVEGSHLMIQSREALPRLAEGPDGLLSLERELGAPLAQGADLLREAQVFLGQLADLGTHLLASLEEALDFPLDLLRRLPEIGQAILALLNGRPRRRLARGELGHGHASLFFFVSAAAPFPGRAPRGPR